MTARWVAFSSKELRVWSSYYSAWCNHGVFAALGLL